MSTGRKRIVVGALVLAAGLVVGCGSSDETTTDVGSPEDTVQAFYDASQSDDSEATCLTLSSATQDLSPEGCVAAFDAAVKTGRNDLPKDFSIDSSSIDGDAATVEVTGDGKKETIDLVLEADGWKIDFTPDTTTIPPVG